ncbi:MAG: hypothetical protein M3357_08470 [Actinomycetota bacterium]|nr:hypothetical protein [Actinomycetota bacterium]
MEKPDMEKMDETKDKIASEPGEQVKEWVEEEGTDEEMTAPKAMAEDTSEGNRAN